MNAQTDTMEFHCGGCGKQIRARINQGGRNFSCPDCGKTILIPKVSLGSHVSSQSRQVVSNDSPQPPKRPKPKRFLKVPTSIGELLILIAMGWLGASLLLLVVSFFSTVMGYLAFVLFLAVTAGTLYQMYLVMRAQQRVLAEKDISLLWGFVRLVAWDPVEGVLFLKNKSVGFKDDCLHDGQGGVRLIYPIFGDELTLRIQLEVQTLQFFDQRVMTREYLGVSVRGTVKWRIIDIEKFYLLLSRELRNTADGNRPADTGFISATTQQQAIPDERNAEISVKKKLELAITWLRILTEEQTRTVMSRVSSGLLIADRLAEAFPEIKAQVNTERSMLTSLAAGTPKTSGGEWTNAADGLANSILDTLITRTTQYGIEIDDVSLQEVGLPEEIVQSCIEAAQSAYLPLLAQRKAAAEVAIRRANLSTDVELLGKEAVGMREVVGAAPGFSLVDFLSNFVTKGMGNQASAAATVGLASQLTNTAPAGILPTTPNPQLTTNK